ncbi:hypothetical protein [Microvirga makkahensis]|uniref:Uncharacterized protein n=1 Tax=Microvirga makkahensis TaxID=1128670 RepID=A0A7X3MSJ1_9HYPH|nr:hypothetical protein [Microvirga makkahensis]MXQ12268.1 hypothetical protein [Microvirga makkahensis]
MLGKLHALVRHESGDDRCPFDLDMFGARLVRHRNGSGAPDDRNSGPGDAR